MYIYITFEYQAQVDVIYGAWSSNELQWLDLNVGHGDSSSNNDHHDDMIYYKPTTHTCPPLYFPKHWNIESAVLPSAYNYLSPARCVRFTVHFNNKSYNSLQIMSTFFHGCYDGAFSVLL